MQCPLVLKYESLSQQDWAAVGQLTQLTRLVMASARLLTATEECRAVVSKLTRLEAWGAGLWSTDMLPVLAACIQLTWWEVGGSRAAAAAFRALCCPMFWCSGILMAALPLLDFPA